MARRKKSTKKRSRQKDQPHASHLRKPAFTFDAIVHHGWFPWVILVVACLVAYINAWPNVLVFDDREFLDGGRFTGLEFSDFLGFFTQSLWEASGNLNNLYRPALVATFGIEYLMFENWPAGFHLVNIFLHIVATLLIFGFLSEVMRNIGGVRGRPDWPVLMATAVFCVHPVLTDAVNSVFNGSEIYVAIATCSGLWYLLRNIHDRPVRAWTFLSLLYFWALLYRESAVVLPALAVLTIWFTSKDAWLTRAKKCLPVLFLLIPLGAYVAMRSHALEAPDKLAMSSQDIAAIQQINPPPIAESVDTPKAAGREVPSRIVATEALGSIGVDFSKLRVKEVIPMWFDALKLMVWPHPLVVVRDVSQTPWLLALAAQLFILAAAIYAWVKKQPVYIFGLLFFYLAILPASRVISEGFLPPLLLDRMLYLPSVGLILCLGAGFQWLSNRTSPRITITIAAVLVCMLVPVTWARNYTWSDELRLLETDFAVTGKNPQLLYSLIAGHRKAGAPNRALELCDEHPEIVQDVVVVSRECAKSAVNARQFTKAGHFFEVSLERGPRESWTHFEYARLLVQLDLRDEARSHFDKALVNEKVPFLREIMSAIMILDMYPHDRSRLAKASEHVNNALQLQPRSREAKQLRQHLDQRL